MSGTEARGVDLAKVALRAVVEATRKNGGTRTAKAKLRPGRTVRRDGREPMGLGAAIGALVTERAWELLAAGATLRERWTTIAPELAGHVTAVAYHPAAGRLTVHPQTARPGRPRPTWSSPASSRPAVPSYAPCRSCHPVWPRHSSRSSPILRRPPRQGRCAPGRTALPATGAPWPVSSSVPSRV
ncbi:hypothetical protein [Streptomyces sp. NPDC047097]|uniref:hypothetical protein n=1 Tax=Streptomyces sp. NPDC047097 TaxID=3155260 RepID=UPI0033E732A8